MALNLSVPASSPADPPTQKVNVVNTPLPIQGTVQLLQSGTPLSGTGALGPSTELILLTVPSESSFSLTDVTVANGSSDVHAVTLMVLSSGVRLPVYRTVVPAGTTLTQTFATPIECPGTIVAECLTAIGALTECSATSPMFLTVSGRIH
jgi:hypothetical protein